MPQQGIQIRNLGQLAGAITARMQQMFQAPPNKIEGVNQSNWPSALQPVAPIAPKGSEPLAIQYMMGQNLAYTPRADAMYSAAMLRALATYPLARICIENVKDQLCRIPWKIQAKLQPGETQMQHLKRTEKDDVALNLTKFFEYPDGEHNWSEWVRPLLEDMLVVDAASILMRRTKNNRIAQLVTIFGDEITRYVDDNGYTPKPPSPAYAQLWEGIPRTDLTTDQLIYKPRNIVRRDTYASQLYGFAPTEQSADEIKVGAARLAYVMAYYSDGGIPNALQIVPSSVTPQKIQESMSWMASELAGNLAKRRHLFMTQGWTEDGKDQVIFPPEPVLADAFDDLHIRKICFTYGTSPQRLMRMMNRASAQSNQEASEEEGLMPWVDWLTGVINLIIQRKAGYTDYEIAFDPYQELDIVKQSVAQTNLVKGGIRTPNEARQAIGDDPSSDTGANDLGMTIATGRVPLEVGPLQLTDPPPPQAPGAPGAAGAGAGRASGSAKPKPKATPKKLATGDLAKYKYGCVMVAVPPESDAGRALAKMQDQIDPAHLMAKGLEKEYHVTVRYGFSGPVDRIRNYLKSQPPFEIALGKTIAFDPSEHSDNAAVIVAQVHWADRLKQMNEDLKGYGEWKEADFEYNPHVTLAYVDPEHAEDYVGMGEAEGIPVQISGAIISEADGK